MLYFSGTGDRSGRPLPSAVLQGDPESVGSSTRAAGSAWGLLLEPRAPGGRRRAPGGRRRVRVLLGLGADCSLESAASRRRRRRKFQHRRRTSDVIITTSHPTIALG